MVEVNGVVLFATCFIFRMLTRQIVTLTVNLSNYVRRRSGCGGGDLDRNWRRSIVSMPACDVCVRCSGVRVGRWGWLWGLGGRVEGQGPRLLSPSLSRIQGRAAAHLYPPSHHTNKITPNHPAVYPDSLYPDCTGPNTGRTGLLYIIA